MGLFYLLQENDAEFFDAIDRPTESLENPSTQNTEKKKGNTTSRRCMLEFETGGQASEGRDGPQSECCLQVRESH